MSSTNFAAAQERVLERRRLREAEARARLAEQQRASPVNHPALQRLPYPLSRLPQSGLSLWNAIKGREGIRPAFRVGQVDAELLDEELLGLLKGQVGEALKYFGPQMREDWSHEIQFALRAILFKLSLWDHDASYGAALQNLKYVDSRSKGPVHSAPTRWQKTLYGLLTVGGRYAWDKWESWLINQEGGYDEKLEGEEGEGWVCLRCGEIVKKCKPWNGDVLEEVRPQSSSGKVVGFAVDDGADEAGANASELERGDEPPMGHSSPLQDLSSDEALGESNHWSTIDKESTADGPEEQTNEMN
ncbi:peroxisome assembly protein (Peroxin-2) [Aspergillus melleus]|uniref:Peroxisome assembly protein (Peroxin-2) n=1 Tax=Aspergillus melleus TaxID=138277 RepID=A0ACC3BFA2_9EURO|nr:peroxisome assembly protein (Peroxin-2) [Aspergillus melleus]